MADPGDSTSQHSAAATDDAHHEGSEATAAAAAAAVTAPVHAPPPKVRLMVSYGGRIQPRPHDNQLAYVGGDTKILSLERPLRFADFAARLAALVGTHHLGDFCVKYQLPGEDLDALVSVTNDEDLEHLVIEYDRLHLLRPAPASGNGSGGSSRGGSNIRLRVFLFPVQSPPQPSGPLETKPERHWFVEALNTVPQPKQETLPVPPAKGLPPQQKHEALFAQQSSPPQQKQESVFAQQSSPRQQKEESVFPQQSSPPQQKQELPSVQQPPAPLPRVVLTPVGPDYLFGLDNGFVPPPAVKVKDPAGDLRENVPVEIPADHVAVSPVVSPAEFHRQIQDQLQAADNASNQPQPPAPAPAAALPSNGSDDSLTRAYPPATVNAEYYVPKFPEKPPVPPPSSAPTYLQVAGRYTSVAPGSGAEHAPVFFIPAPHGYYATTASPGANSYPAAMYAVAPPNASGNANGSAPSHGMSNATAYAPAPQVAYDSNGRAIYYTSVLPQYPSPVNGMSAAGAVLGSEPAKPPVS